MLCHTRPGAGFFLLSLLFVFLLGGGCTREDESVYYVDRNFADREKTLQTLQHYLDGINTRDLAVLSRVFPADFISPDAQQPDRVHSRQSILDGFAAFFRRATEIEYRVEDVFVKLAADRARLEFRLGRRYTGHAPFVHQVNDLEVETVYLAPDGEGNWRFQTLPSRMLPPELVEI